MDLAAVFASPDSKFFIAFIIFAVWQAAALYWSQRIQRTLFERHEREDQARHEEVKERLEKVETTVAKVIETFWNRRRG